MKESTPTRKTDCYITCLYCQQSKHRSFFNREHVLPQAFGKFKDGNFVLKNKVCKTCNSLLGKELDLPLARGTFEGLQRYTHKLKNSKEFSHLTSNQKIEIRLIDGALKGLHMTPHSSEKHDALLFEPISQIGFKKEGEEHYDFFPINQIPPKEQITKIYGSNYKVMIPPGTDETEATKELEKIGIKLQEKSEITTGSGQEELKNCSVTWLIDDTIKRAVAKIALNCLANFNDLTSLQHRDFDIIRRYILYGEKPDHELVHADSTPILHDEKTSNFFKLGHLITLNLTPDNTTIIAQVSLFNYLRYTIYLSQNYSGIPLNIGFGYFFNVNTKEIIEVKKR